MRSAVSLLWILLAGCSRAGGHDAQAAAAQAEYRGKVVITGSEPATAVQLAGSDGSMELAGTLEPELRRLAGAGVAVQGSLEGRRPMQRLEVRSYEILDIDGEVPSTGVIQTRDGQLWLAGEDTLKLIEPPDGLSSRNGAKVWIVGARSSGALQVQSYGIIRE